MSEATLETIGLEAVLHRQFRVRVPDLRVTPGQVVAVPTTAALAAGLAELFAGHGFGWVASGELRLGGKDLQRMSPENRQHHGLFVPRLSARAPGEAQAFREMLDEVNQVRRAYGMAPVPTLTALIATGMDKTFEGRTTELARIGDDLRSLLFQALLTGAPLAVVPVPAGLPRGLEALLETVIAEALQGGRSLLLLGELPALLHSLPSCQVTAPVEVAESAELDEAS